MILPRASTQLNPVLPTANGLDKLPAWFLTLAAPVLCGPDQQYVVVDVICSSVPNQWKQARIRPVPKTPAPQQAADYLPVSITPVLSRIVERIVVHGVISIRHCRRLHPRYSLLTNSLSGLQAPPLLPALLCSTQS